LARSGVKASVCAWEDDIEVFREAVFGFGGPGLDERIHWFEPDADPERLLDEYLTRVEYLSKQDNTLIHICDPWNAFNHDFGGDTETRYVQKMLVSLQTLVRELDVSVIIITHLPKRQGRGFRPFSISEVSGSKEFANKCDVGICIANTQFIADIPEMEDGELKDFKLTRDHVDKAIEAAGVGRKFEGKEHMLMVTDKIKVRGMEKRGMGVRDLRAFVYDRFTSKLKLDPLATELAKAMW
jgi:hypothetical protein